MTIEIHSPSLKVSERVLESIKRSVTNLGHLGEPISRAEIFLTEQDSSRSENKNCNIRLSMVGDTLFVHKTSGSFDKAAFSVIQLLKRRLKERLNERNLPPDQIITTVDV